MFLKTVHISVYSGKGYRTGCGLNGIVLQGMVCREFSSSGHGMQRVQFLRAWCAESSVPQGMVCREFNFSGHGVQKV